MQSAHSDDSASSSSSHDHDDTITSMVMDSMLKKKSKKKKDKKMKEKKHLEGSDQESAKKSKKRKYDDDEILSSKKAKKMHQEIKEKKRDDNVTEILSPEEIEGALNNFGFSPLTLKGLKDKGINYLFPVQARTFQVITDGFDVITQARTGTGKTLSFVLPLVEKLKDVPKKSGRPPIVLVMAPTRELAKQIGENFETICPSLSTFCIYGGTSYWPQETAIRRGLDVLVGTPGRILDYVNKKMLDLSKLKHVVLDEVDRMLDMGFAETVEDILKSAYNQEKPDSNPQTLLFSATVPPWVHETGKKYMKSNLKQINLVGNERNKTSTNVEHLAIRSGYHQRASIINDVIRVNSGINGRTMIFCETKKDANELSMNKVLTVEAQVLHGDIPQQQREITLKGFRDGRFPCLIATDVAARGLDIPEIDLVIQCNPPKYVDDYIHRSGRTGRAQRTGVCVCFYKPNEEWDLTKVERQAGIKFKKVGPPSPKEIVKASASEAIRVLSDIPEKAIEKFKEVAKELIEEKDPEMVVAAALAYIAGAAELASRSLITSQEGSTTYLIKTSFPLERKGDVFKAIGEGLPYDVKEAAGRVKLGTDNYCAVFDIPSDMDKVVKEQWQDTNKVQLAVADELPSLQEDIFSSSRGRGGRGSPGGWRGRQENGFSRGARGQGRGGRGGSFKRNMDGRGFRGARGGGFRGRRGSGGRGGFGGPSRGGFRGGRDAGQQGGGAKGTHKKFDS